MYCKYPGDLTRLWQRSVLMTHILIFRRFSRLSLIFRPSKVSIMELVYYTSQFYGFIMCNDMLTCYILNLNIFATMVCIAQ